MKGGVATRQLLSFICHSFSSAMDRPARIPTLAGKKGHISMLAVKLPSRDHANPSHITFGTDI